MGYPGLFNSSYQPSPLEVFYISTPENQLGPVIMGEVVVALLQGVMFVQYYEYVRNFWKERRWTKWLVHLTFILCVVKFAYVWWFTWNRFVPHYGDWAYLARFSPIAVPIGISSTIPSAVCQIFYIYRCWALSHNWFFLIPAVLSLMTTVGSGIALTYGSALAAGGNVKVTSMILTSINISLASALICDIFITTFTCFYLIREKTGFKGTDSLVMRLIKCSIESAAGPTVVALINQILSNKATDNQWFLLPNFALSHVYGASLLYSVNARKAVSLGSASSAANTLSHTKPSARRNDYQLQDRGRNGKSEVYVEVQTIMRPDNSIPEEPHSSESHRSKGRSQDVESYVVRSDKAGYYI